MFDLPCDPRDAAGDLAAAGRPLPEDVEGGPRSPAVRSVGHDLNNVLTIIIAHTSSLLRALDGDGLVRRHAESIDRAARWGGSLTRLLAHPAGGESTDGRADLNVVVREAVDGARELLGPTIDVRTDLHPAIGQVSAWPAALGLVLVNLLLNARDAMPHGGTVAIRTRPVEVPDVGPPARPGPHVAVEVSDTGTGMDHETLAHVFEPLFTTKQDGRGLGLANVARTVAKHGGWIEARSHPGRGSTFRIFLVPASGSPGVEGGGAGEPPVRGRETVLVVEDEDDVRDLVRDVLQLHGYTVLDARDGFAAISACARWQGPIDLLITDLRLPGLPGNQLVERLTAARPELAVLYLSGESSGDWAPGTSVLVKPFELDHLVRRVRELLDGRPRG